MVPAAQRMFNKTRINMFLKLYFFPNSRARLLQSTPLAGDKKFLYLSENIKDGHGVHF